MSNLTYGAFVGADYQGEVNPRTILFWGHNPIVSGADGELSFPVRRALERGSFGIAVDPRRSETARLCQMWLPIRPGTDAALALALAQVIIGEELYDREFVRQWTTGFEELAAHVAGCTPAWAAAITGVAARDIAAAARRYATEKPGVIEWGVALEQNPNCLQNVRAVALLRGLTGNLDIPGGDLLAAGRLRPYPVLREALSSEALAKRIGAKDYKLLGGLRAFMPSAHIPGVFRAMRTGEPYRIRAFLMIGNNPLLTVANAREVRESMLCAELIVASELFMTPSAALADYVLPAAYWPEVNQVVELPYVMETGVVAQQRVVQVGECRQDEEVMIDLARRMGLPGAAQSLEEILDYRLEPLGLTFGQLKERHLVQPPQEYRKFEKAGFRTPSRKVELFCKGLQRLGYDPLPTHREPPESPVSTPEVAREFPYILTTGSRRREFFHSEHRQIPSLRKRRPDPLAEFHPLVAARHGIVNARLGLGRVPARPHPDEGAGHRRHPRRRGQCRPRLVVSGAGRSRVRRLGLQRQPAHREHAAVRPGLRQLSAARAAVSGRESDRRRFGLLRVEPAPCCGAARAGSSARGSGSRLIRRQRRCCATLKRWESAGVISIARAGALSGGD